MTEALFYIFCGLAALALFEVGARVCDAVVEFVTRKD